MKRLLILAALITAATAALAQPDYDTDSFGVYFDQAGMNRTIWTAPFTPFNVYLLLSNPSAPVDGFECTVTPVGGPYYILATDLGPGALDVDGSVNGFAVGAASPYPATQPMTLVRWQFMVPSMTPVYYLITEATTPSLPGGLPVVTGGGVLRRCGVSSGDVTMPVACINTMCFEFSEESMSFGGIKGLFR